MQTPKTAILTFGLAAMAGCATNTSGNTTSVCADLVQQDLVPSPAWQGTVFTIVMENKSQKDIIGSKDAPFINSLAKQNVIAAGYRDNFVHPSEPNYLWMVAGENFGILDDEAPSVHHIDARSHIADQIEMQGMTWKTYQESMGKPCNLSSSYPYEPKHNPFIYFDDINGWDGTKFQSSARCNDHVVDYAQFDKDLASGSLAKYVFITPNMINDMHDGSVAQGDAWLAKEIPKILSSKEFNNGGVLFLTWDEGASGTDDPPMIVISPNAKQGYVSNTAFNASSYLATIQKMVGTQALPCNTSSAASVNTMDELFTVPLDAVQRTLQPNP